MELRFLAFRRPLASQQDIDFFVGLLHAAEGPDGLAAGQSQRGPSLEGSVYMQETNPVEIFSTANLKRELRGSKSQRNRQGQSKGAAAAAGAGAGAAAGAAGVKEEQQAEASQFIVKPMPHNFVAIDLQGLRSGIARDEKTSSALLARLQRAKELSASEEKLQNCLIRDLRERLHTEIALMHVIADDEKKASLRGFSMFDKGLG
ncbi:hypothetical protein Emag_001976 [Eimeria magna]